MLYKYNMEALLLEIREKIQRNSHLSLNGACLLWTGAVTKDGLYGVCSYKDPITGSYKKKHAHRVVYMAHVADFRLNPSLDCSHLCHNARCVTVAHLSLEPHAVNNNRQHCKNLGHCLGHGAHAACRLALRL